MQLQLVYPSNRGTLSFRVCQQHVVLWCVIRGLSLPCAIDPRQQQGRPPDRHQSRLAIALTHSVESATKTSASCYLLLPCLGARARTSRTAVRSNSTLIHVNSRSIIVGKKIPIVRKNLTGGECRWCRMGWRKMARSERLGGKLV